MALKCQKKQQEICTLKGSQTGTMHLVYNLRRQFGGQVSDSLCVLLSYPGPFFSSFCHVDAFHSGQLRHEFAVLFWKTLTDGCRQ